MAGAWEIYTAALVGCGRIGYSLGLDKKREQPASHTMALNANPRISLIAGCDIDNSKLRKWQETNRKAYIYSDSANLYARQKPSIIVLAVPESSHYREAFLAIRIKPRLLILEKPVALNLKEAMEIQSLAERNGVAVLVNHERRFAEDYNLVKKYMKKIGTIESIHAQLHSGMCVYNSNEEDSGAYSLFHDGTHLVDIILFLLEDEEFSTLEKVSDLKKTFEQKGQGLLKQVLSNPEPEYKYVNSILKNPKILSCVRSDDSCVRQLSVFYETEKCPEVIISMSGRSKFFNFELTITGTEGRICIGNGFLKFYQRGESPLYSGFTSLISDKSVKLPKKTLYFSNMVQNAVDFLDGKEKLKSTIQTGINSLAVLEEIKNLIK